MYKGNRWEVLLDEKTCSCRVWQVKGLSCVHAVAFIAFTRDSIWDNYIDPYFTIDKYKEAYALEIAPMPGKDQWVHIDTSEKIHPPIVKRPIGRPRKNRIVAHDKTKKDTDGTSKEYEISQVFKTWAYLQVAISEGEEELKEDGTSGVGGETVGGRELHEDDFVSDEEQIEGGE
ncbi:transposase, MuDR, MULE transposase domain protein [Tanacetum coccineum]|uniref:Transposase, MuDR, MULE transposase domain protein n=1 Tax=Tanacetum coccineum TaxID=301880 RepID=A0ABQ5CP34_9ASTR